MARNLDPEAFLQEALTFPVVDVRSPGEFLQGHIPDAFNIPLFDDQERAIIGTLYNRSGSDTAIRKGIEIATPKIPLYLASLNAVIKDRRILVHCWRGGMRSAHMAALFEQEGFEAGLLSGGYKAYRRHVRSALGAPARIIVVGGYTGSGKTELLRMIGQLGHQVIDLEELACHKGSAFGALGQPPQPTNEQFENDLFRIWSGLDLSKPVWLEDESRMIGRVTLPDPVFEKISGGILLRIEVPRTFRVKRLVSEYAAYDKRLLAEAVGRISERLGVPRTREALEDIEKGAFEKVADNVLRYYDKAYQYSIDRFKGRHVFVFELDGEPDQSTAENLISFIEKTLNNGTDLP
jgi:tRNA 2-selenouridine synthase